MQKRNINPIGDAPMAGRDRPRWFDEEPPEDHRVTQEHRVTRSQRGEGQQPLAEQTRVTTATEPRGRSGSSR